MHIVFPTSNSSAIFGPSRKSLVFRQSTGPKLATQTDTKRERERGLGQPFNNNTQNTNIFNTILKKYKKPVH